MCDKKVSFPKAQLFMIILPKEISMWLYQRQSTVKKNQHILSVGVRPPPERHSIRCWRRRRTRKASASEGVTLYVLVFVYMAFTCRPLTNSVFLWVAVIHFTVTYSKVRVCWQRRRSVLLSDNFWQSIYFSAPTRPAEEGGVGVGCTHHMLRCSDSPAQTTYTQKSGVCSLSRWALSSNRPCQQQLALCVLKTKMTD